MSVWKAKRFWKQAEAVACEGGYTVTLDGRAIKTPAKAALVVPTMEMARAIAAEWDAQDENVRPESMPFTRSANAAIDKVTIQFDEVADMVADYGDSDLLCYRADTPLELVERQNSAWNPMLEWAEKELGARLEPRTGVIHAPQDSQAVARLRHLVHQLSAFELTAFHDLVGISGSLILGFAAIKGVKDAESIWKLSRVDETWQVELWGHDEEDAEIVQKKLEQFLHAHNFWSKCNQVK